MDTAAAIVRVLVVEDEPLTRRAIALALTRDGFEVFEAEDARGCRRIIFAQRCDAVVLDLGLPDMDGMALAAELRARGDLGLLVVTRRSAPEARIEALDIGADDYLVKPVHLGELSARIRSVLRRRGRRPNPIRRLGAWIIDLDARTVMRATAKAELTRGEFDILARLVEVDGAVVSREDLLAAVSRRPQEADLRSVDVLVSRLRRKLAEGSEGQELIVTAPGLGYQLGVRGTAEAPATKALDQEGH